MALIIRRGFRAMLEAANAEIISLTAADAITGTPLYLPPESISDSEAADARSDLYSLGGVAYYLLTGHAVFEGGSVMDIIRQHVEAVPLLIL